MTTNNLGQAIELTGKSGHTYQGMLYEDKSSSSGINAPAIVCLTNSYYDESGWHHVIRDIYDTHNVEQTLAHFRERDDISHLILIPKITDTTADWDQIDDLRRHYIHH